MTQFPDMSHDEMMQKVRFEAYAHRGCDNYAEVGFSYCNNHMGYNVRKLPEWMVQIKYEMET